MKCDFCSKKATVFLTQLVEGQMKKVCLCDGCAQERGVTDPTGFSLADLLLGGLPGGPGTVTGIARLHDFRSTRGFGPFVATVYESNKIESCWLSGLSVTLAEPCGHPLPP